MPRSATNKNRVRGAFQSLYKKYAAGSLPIAQVRAIGPKRATPHTYEPTHVARIAKVGRVSGDLPQSVMRALEEYLTARIQQLLAHGKEGKTFIGKNNVLSVLQNNLFYTLEGETKGALEPKDFMNQDAIKTINKRLGITRMCEEAKELLQQDAVVWFTFLHNIACAAAHAQKRQMVHGKHVQYAAACLAPGA